MAKSMLGKLVQEARATGGGENITAGDYLWAVERLVEIDGYEGRSFIAELLVLEAEAIDEKVKPNKVGSSVSCVWNVTKQKEMALGNIKSFLMGLFGVPEDEITADVLDSVVDEEKNPMRGMRIAGRTMNKINQGRTNPANRGQVLVIPKWRTIEQTPEQVAEWRKAMGEAKKYAPADTGERAADRPPADRPAPDPSEPAPKRNAGILAGVLGGKK
jgi:hypothetical protein